MCVDEDEAPSRWHDSTLDGPEVGVVCVREW